MLYLAIDQHRKQLTVNLRDEEGNVLLQRQVSTRWQAVREFFQDMRERGRQAGGWMVVVEVCGFNDWLLKLLVDYEVREIVLLIGVATSWNTVKRATRTGSPAGSSTVRTSQLPPNTPVSRRNPQLTKAKPTNRTTSVKVRRRMAWSRT